ncbi:MAG: polysaccharide biosynthesis C-terminal domain-containing protein [Ardenticatenaceae bacterium]
MPSILYLNGMSAWLSFVFAILGNLFFVGEGMVLDNVTLLLLGIAGAASSISLSMNGVFFGAKKVKQIVIWNIFALSVHTILAVAIALWFVPTVKLFIMLDVGILLLNAVGKTILGGWGAWRKLSFDLNIISPILKYGFSVYTGRVLMLISQKIDMYLLLFLAGPLALGYYSISASFGQQLWMFPSAINLVMMTNIASRPDVEAAKMTVSASQMVVSLSLFGSFVMGGLGFWGIPLLYGEQYQTSVVPFLIMLPGIIAISSYMLLEPYFQSRGQVVIPIKLTFGGAVANLIASLILIPTFGLNGAAIAYSTSYIFQLILSCAYFSRNTNLPFWSVVNVLQMRKYLTRPYLLRYKQHFMRFIPS